MFSSWLMMMANGWFETHRYLEISPELVAALFAQTRMAAVMRKENLKPQCGKKIWFGMEIARPQLFQLWDRTPPQLNERSESTNTGDITLENQLVWTSIQRAADGKAPNCGCQQSHCGVNSPSEHRKPTTLPLIWWSSQKRETSISKQYFLFFLSFFFFLSGYIILS